MTLFTVCFSELSEEIFKSGKDLNKLTDFIKRKKSTLTIDEVNVVKNAIKKRFIGHFKKRLKQSNGNKAKFYKLNKTWLQCK